MAATMNNPDPVLEPDEATDADPKADGYFHQTQRPLVCLAFLLPWVLFYEVGTLLLGTMSEGAEPGRVVAYLLLERFFRLFGATALYLPGLALIVVFLISHVASREPWKLRWQTLAGMGVESLLLALPLLIFNQVLAAQPAMGGVAQWGQNLVLAIGAGIYEELVFRLMCITLLTILLVDIVKIRKATAMVIIVVLSSLVFAAHHYPPLGRDTFDTVTFLFRAGAGAYLATVFVVRGFGLAAGCHAVYDVIVVTWTALGS